MTDEIRFCHHCGTKVTTRLVNPTCSACYKSLTKYGVLPDLNIDCDVCGDRVTTNMERRYRMHSLCSDVVSVRLSKMGKSRRDRIKAILRGMVEESQPEDLRVFLEDNIGYCIRLTAGPVRKNPEIVPYESVPDEWGVASFMAKLKHNGERAREYLRSRDTTNSASG